MARHLPKNLFKLAQTAPLSSAHWNRFFLALRQEMPVDRICALLRMDRYTGVVVRVAQRDDLEVALGGESLFEDRDNSRVFKVIGDGEAIIVRPDEWSRFPDLQFFWPTLQSNLKFPLSLGGWPAVWNVWSILPNQYTQADVDRLQPLAAEMSGAAFRFEAGPVRLAIRQMLAFRQHRQGGPKPVAGPGQGGPESTAPPGLISVEEALSV